MAVVAERAPGNIVVPGRGFDGAH